MGKIIAVVAILLALFTAGCIAYIAWELTSEKKEPGGPEGPDRSDPD